ncbi:AAA family ATPase [Pseudomonas juntendi]|uniref:AAA family ATPase n=1 Tax=Pseudomonas juntendi TaxID=2666183 RepID=A0A7W2QA50_9PSED|nr:AAA family ATPase [Pseudomonas juntendi]MBA6098530.1 AAA family ATPase [Pseudomonas juntendi]
MKQLKSLTLSNIRRFGIDTTIEFSRGATILLAPNGTGKTAIFEALELGLTGKVSRLADNLLPIIRDAQSTAGVRLDFDDTHASAHIGELGEVERSGDLSSVFPETDSEDIPYLLRLTHLLDQRERDWLVQADPKVAGSQLAKLPIGRDGSQVTSALGGIRRSLTEQLNQAKASLETLTLEFSEWQSLKHDRDQAAAQSQGALRSREHIGESITDIASQTQALEQLPSGLLVPPLGQDGLETVHNALEQLVQAKLTRLKDQIKALAEVDGLIGRFVSEQTRIDQLSKELKSGADDLARKKQDRGIAAASHEQVQEELVSAERERDAIVQQLNRYASEAQAKELVSDRGLVLENADQALVEAENKAAVSRTEHEGNQQLNLQHTLINDQRKALLQTDADLVIAQQFVGHWEELLKFNVDISAAISDGEEEEEQLQAKLATALSAQTVSDAEVLAATHRYESLTSAADAIRSAVATIAAHLPPDRIDCPLCGIEHGAEALKKRVANALQTLDPEVVQAAEHLKTSRDLLDERRKAVTAVEAELTACRGKLTELGLQLSGLSVELSDLKSNALLGGDTLPLARESIRRRGEANTAAKRQLDEKQSNLTPPIAPDAFDVAKEAYDAAVRAVDAARQSRSDATIRLEQATAALAAITADAPPAQTLEELSNAQKENAAQINDLTARSAAEQSALSRQQLQLTELTDTVAALQTQLTEAQSRLATVRASWRQLSIDGDPNAEVASSHEAQMQSKADQLTRHTEVLQTIKIEIDAWSKLEQARLSQGMLDRRRGELSEDDFTTDLKQRIEERESSIERLSKLSNAMESLSQSLSTEIANVQKHVLAVVPRWQALLKRVVRDQRFTGTSLDFRTAYRSERAGVSVPLHGGEVAVPAIASEAQLTDLQLTFLLSMALDHPWSAWRGLLLDDPTQHHDMVHAAAVFDVLRDYIVDHGFQVVIATHDALQARYFMRKLQNDGIEARLWSLVPTSDGVTAVETQWPGKHQLSVDSHPSPTTNSPD